MSRLEIIPELTNLLLEFTVSVLVNKPPDLVAYASEYFTRMLEDRGGGGGGGGGRGVNVKRSSKTSATSDGSNQQSPTKSGNRSSSLESNHMDEEEEFSEYYSLPLPLFLSFSL